MKHRLEKTAWVALTLNSLFSAAESLCSVFVSVYLWVNSNDFFVLCRYHITLYAVTPVFFILVGWYAQYRDRLHVYRLGLVLNALFYGALLLLRERAPHFAVPLGAMLGVTWGVYWAGANTFNFDVTSQGKREYYFGLLSAITGVVSLLAPLLSGFVIRYVPEKQMGYLVIFAVVVILYMLSFAISFMMPTDSVRRPFHLKRALFPGRDQRDWRLMMMASASLAGSFNIFPFLLSLLMFMQTKSELSVGGFASIQALASVVVSYFVGRAVTVNTRRPYMFWGVVVLLLAGGTMFLSITKTTLFIFGMLRSLSGPLFGIPYSGLRYDIMGKSVENPAQRIEYISAWEVPLAIGRVMMMLVLMSLYSWFTGNEFAIRVALFLMCAVRILTYRFTTGTSLMRRPTLKAKTAGISDAA